MQIKTIVRKFLEKFGIAFTRAERLARLEITQSYYFLTQDTDRDRKQKWYKFWDESKAQLKQDLFVLACLNFKENGYFVEFGATNGIDLSNTWMLEKKFGWKGILAEPSMKWQDDLIKTRECDISTKCVWKTTGESIQFHEADAGALSTIKSYINSDPHKSNRKKGNNYFVQTITLTDLLKNHNAPYIVDYLSIDTEGSEYDILSAFDFDTYKVKIITVEHNFTESREKIYQLLTRHGYIRALEDYSQWDDWYVLKTEFDRNCYPLNGKIASNESRSDSNG